MAAHSRKGAAMLIGGVITGLIIVGLFFSMIASSPRTGR